MPYGFPFADIEVPQLWSDLVAEFGREITYLPLGDVAQALTITAMVKDGIEGEDLFPGRYSYADVEQADLPSGAQKGDEVQTDDGRQFEVVRVDAFATGYARVVLHEIGPRL